jgi:hypothetical protein
MQKQYHELIAGRIYFGGASDIQQIADVEHIDVVVDLREESRLRGVQPRPDLAAKSRSATTPSSHKRHCSKTPYKRSCRPTAMAKSGFPLRRRQGPDWHRGRRRPAGAWLVQHARRSSGDG